MAEQRGESDRVADLLDLHEGRLGIPLLDDTGIRDVLTAAHRIAVIGASADPCGRPGPPVMSSSPFLVDPAVAERIARLTATIGGTFTQQVAASLADGHVLPNAAVDRMIATFGLDGPRDAMLLALPVATGLAVPSISGFHVGAVGLEARTGDLILGGNVEFPGLDMGSTIHAEGFVFTRAFSCGTSIAVLATGEARPCGHCRQFISEFESSHDLELIDSLGHTLTMSDLYPWPFIPGDLDAPGIVGGSLPWPELALAYPRVPRDVAELLVRTGRHAHAPYSQCPAAIVLRLADGQLIAGASIESVAFNPSIGPLQAAIVELIALDYAYADIESATLAVVAGGAVDPTHESRALLAAIAPTARLTITTWA